jgi:hypothetical protein
MTKAVPFSQTGVRRLIAAVKKEGLPVKEVSVGPDGTITVQTEAHFADAPSPLDHDPTADPWHGM